MEKELVEKGIIIKVSGPLVVAEGLTNSKMFDLVRVSKQNLLGEIIEIKSGAAFIQVYEDTTGIGPGDEVIASGRPLSVELGPGLLGSIFDGTQRPLDIIRDVTGDFIERGTNVQALNRKIKWSFKATAKEGSKIEAGDVLGEVDEGPIKHFILVPPGVSGTINSLKDGDYNVEEVIGTLEDATELRMLQSWPVRQGRPFKEKMRPAEPLITGQRVIDTFFPLAKGGTATAPGPFGSGKTVIQHQLAKWADSEIIIFIGVGERGNEMTDVLLEFAKLKDPKTGELLLKRTVFIANTSNMPVAAREACIYTGMAIAEYFRDMGYNVSLQADSTSRWAEALREISGRLEEMPGEEGYPAYLASKLAQFYERAGKVKCLGSVERTGSVSAIGSVSPPGGDLSEPVVQNTLRVVKVFWSLEDTLAFKRHFPAINWLTSYSLYAPALEDFWRSEVAPDFIEHRKNALLLLQKESDLLEIVRLVGMDALSTEERIVLETARLLREDFLQQNAFDEVDTYTSLKKQYQILKIIMLFHEKALLLAAEEVEVNDMLQIKALKKLATAKYVSEDKLSDLQKLENELMKEMEGLVVRSVASK